MRSEEHEAAIEKLHGLVEQAAIAEDASHVFRELFLTALSAVLNSLTENGATIAAGNIRRIELLSSPDKIAAVIRQRKPEFQDAVDREAGESVAFYDDADLCLYFCDHARHSSWLPTHVAHELTHAIDKDGHLSSSAEWLAAHKSPGTWKLLTSRAWHDPREAMAEIGALVYSEACPVDELEEYFPGPMSFFKSRGLL